MNTEQLKEKNSSKIESCFITNSSTEAKSFIRYHANEYGASEEEIQSYIDCFDLFKKVRYVGNKTALCLLAQRYDIFTLPTSFVGQVKENKMEEHVYIGNVESYLESPIQCFDTSMPQQESALSSTVCVQKESTTVDIGSKISLAYATLAEVRNYLEDHKPADKKILLDIKGLITLINDFIANNITQDIKAHALVESKTIEYIVDYAIKYGVVKLEK